MGNRGVWWGARVSMDVNALTPQILAALGLNLNNPADLQLLISPVNSALAVSRGFSKLPYPGFPSTATVAQSLRPFPQFTRSRPCIAAGRHLVRLAAGESDQTHLPRSDLYGCVLLGEAAYTRRRHRADRGDNGRRSSERRV